MDENSAAPRDYRIVFAALIILTIATVGLSFLRFGPWHLFVGMGIGALKAALVGLFFMHLNRSPARTWLIASVGLFWLGIMIVLTMSDYFTRPLATL